MDNAAIINLPPAPSAHPIASHHDHSGAASDAHLVDLWLAGRPTSTAAAYAGDAGRFLAFLDTSGDTLRTATVAHVQGYVSQLDGAAATKARRIYSVKSLMSFAYRTGYVQFNVASVVQTPKVPNDLAERILTEEQVIRMIAAAQAGRDQTLIRLLYVSGARVSEAAGLRWRHVHARGTECQITVHGKGGKTRHILLTATVARDLADLRRDAPEDAPVFLSRTGRPLLPRDIRRLVAKVAKLAGLMKAVSPHWMRHSHASHCADRGASLSLIQADLGHASVATTSRYLHARPGDGSARYLPA